MQTPKVTIFGLAYNAQAYVGETIESILAQTEPSWEFIICNNGSTDRTGEICEQYAKKDPRIKVFHNKENMVRDNGAKYPQDRNFWPEFHGEYVTMIDSDDLMHPDFIKATYERAQTTHADIVVVSTQFFADGQKPYQITGSRDVPDCISRNDRELEPLFSLFYPNFRPIWGKLFRTDFFEQHYQYAWEKPQWMHNGMDTFTTLGYLEKASIVTGIHTPLFYYRLRSGSLFHKLDAKQTVRIRCGQVLFDRGMSCLKAHNIATQRNINYLYSVLMGHMWDLLNLVTKSSAPKLEKLSFLHHMFHGEPSLDSRVFSMGWNHLKAPILEALSGCVSAHPTAGLDWSFYSIRLYAALKELESGSYLQFIAFYSALCDPENSTHVGMGELPHRICYNEREQLFQNLSMEQQKNYLSCTQRLVQWYTDSARSLEFEQLSQQLGQYLEAQQLEHIIETLSQMASISPLDTMVLYFRGLMSWQVGDHSIGLKIIQCAKALYPDDPDIASLHTDMCQLMAQQEDNT